jgi:gamma-glutamyltranspeptidase
MSSMTPTIVFRNNAVTGIKEPYVAIGAPGGATIIGNHSIHFAHFLVSFPYNVCMVLILICQTIL